MFQQNRTEKLWGERKKKKDHQVRLSMKKCLRKSTSQVHGGYATNGTTWKIYKIPWIELTDKCGDWVTYLP